MLLESRQNIEPPRNTKNGHRVVSSSGCVISIPKDDECFKSMSFVVSCIIRLFIVSLLK